MPMNDTLVTAISTGLTSASPGIFVETGALGDNPDVSPLRDIDLYSVELQAGDRITVDIDAQVLGSGIDSFLRLFNSLGEVVTVNDNAFGLDSQLTFTVAATDTYFVGISSFANINYDPFIAGSGDLSNTGIYALEIALVAPPQFVASSISLTIPETSEAPIEVAIADSDTPLDTLSAVIMDGNRDNDRDGIFAFGAPTFNADTGVFEIAIADRDEIDFETGTNFFLTLQASDGTSLSTAFVDIAIADVNEAPVIEDATFNPVNANSIGSGSSIGSLTAFDPDFDDTLTLAIASGNDPDGNGLGAFELNEFGEIIVIAPGELTQDFTLEVSATDDEGLQAIAQVVIPTFAPPAIASVSTNLSENAPVGTIVPLSIQDIDTAIAELSVAITSGNLDSDGDGIFAFGEPTFDADASQWQIAVTDSDDIDADSFGSLFLNLSVSDGEFSRTGNIDIALEGINEAPVIGSITSNLIFASSAFEGATAASISVIDPEFDSLTFEIVGGNEPDIDGDGVPAFAIASSFGGASITVLDPDELVQDFTLAIAATDQEGLQDTANVTIPVIPLDLTPDNDPPNVADASFELNAANASAGSFVGSVLAGDPDFEVPTFAITAGNNGGAFAIDPSFGSLTVADPAALTQDFTLEVTVTDPGGLTDTATVAVDTFAVPTFAGISPGTLNENSEVGTVLALDLQDADTPLANLSVAIASGNADRDEDGTPAFSAPSFNADTGQWEIAVADSDDLDFETGSIFSLELNISDGEFSSTAFPGVALANLNEAPTATDTELDPVNANNAFAGQFVGIVEVSDPDFDLLTLSIVGGNDPDGDGIPAFEFDPFGSSSLLVADPGELTQDFTLAVTATDSAGEEATAQVTIPVFADPTIDFIDDVFIPENSLPETPIALPIQDLDTPLDQLIVTLTDGNFDLDGDGTFAFSAPTFNPDTAQWEIALADSDDLDFESLSNSFLSIEVSDGETSVSRNFDVFVEDINEPPAIANPNPTFALVDASTATIGQFVGQGVASDPDFGDELSFAITAGNDAGSLAIDPLTGEISVADPTALGAAPVQLEVTVTDLGDLQATTTVTLPIDIPPTVEPTSFAIAENLAAGEIVGQVTANDDTGIQAIALSENGDLDGDGIAPFAIAPDSGEITIRDPDDIDFEGSGGRFFLTATATNTNGLADSAEIIVNLDDLNEAPSLRTAVFAPIGGASFELDRIGSDSESNDTIATAIATSLSSAAPGSFLVSGAIGNNPELGDPGLDVDLFEFQLEAGDEIEIDLDADSVFDFFLRILTPSGNALTDSNAGTLTFLAPQTGIYYLGVSDTNNRTYDPQVAGSGTPSNNAGAYELELAIASGIDTAGSGDFLGQAIATDPDLDDTPTFEILGGNNDTDSDGTEAIAIDNQGNIIVTDPDDLLDTFRLDVEVTDRGGLTDSATIVIPVDLPGNQAPILEDVALTVDENSDAGTIVGNLPNSDPDFNSPEGDELEYTIIDGNPDPNGNGDRAFSADPTGQIRVEDSGDLNFEDEANRSFELTVRVTDAEGTTDTATVTVAVEDINEPPAIANIFLDRVTLDPIVSREAAAIGDIVGTVVATDPEGGGLSFEITAGNDPEFNERGTFVIDNETGEIAIANNNELQPDTFFLTVEVTDEFGLTSSTQVVVPVGTQAPTIEAATFEVAENSSFGTTVGTVTASDPDSDPLNFAIVAGNDPDQDGLDAFAINPETGAILVLNPSELNFEAIANFTLTVVVTDPAQAIATTEVTVNLSDINEAPIIDPASFEIPANSASGRAIGTVSASDPDGDIPVFGFAGGNQDRDGDGTRPFAIASNTGTLTVSDADDLATLEDNPFRVTVTADDGQGEIAEIAVDISALPAAPVIVNNGASFGLDPDSFDGALVEFIEAFDPDRPSDSSSLSYQIAGGNQDRDGDGTSAFAIGETGLISVADSDDVADLSDTPFTLSILVTDADGDSTEGTFSIVSGNGSIVIPETIAFTTPLPDPDSDPASLVRPSIGSTESFAIGNSGNAPLLLAGISVPNGLGNRGVSVNFDELLEASREITPGLPGLEILPGETLAFATSYVPPAADDSFNNPNGLTVASSDPDTAEAAIVLQGASTFDSDIDYSGDVGFSDVTLANELFNTPAEELDPALNIDGRGGFGFSDIALLDSEFGSTLG